MLGSRSEQWLSGQVSRFCFLGLRIAAFISRLTILRNLQCNPTSRARCDKAFYWTIIPSGSMSEIFCHSEDFFSKTWRVISDDRTLFWQ